MNWLEKENIIIKNLDERIIDNINFIIILNILLNNLLYILVLQI